MKTSNNNISSNENQDQAFCQTEVISCGKVSVLFVRKDSIYKSMGIDCWDIDRDARLWPGGNPIIAHPPCRAWGQLSHMAKPRPDEKELAIWSIHQIRKHGGVLEHPRASKLWKEMNLPLGNEIDEFGGFTLCIDQSWWGHRAQKRTLLYICGAKRSELPRMPLKFELVTHVITQGLRKGQPGWRPRVTQYERESTPAALAEWLIEVASLCRSRHCR